MLSNARTLAHEAVARVVRPGDRVVDATLGNGRDALFLCALIGEKGTLYGFDVQAEALERSRERLKGSGCAVRLFCEGHERMAERVEGPVSAVMFNLGWLPGGDKTVTTRVESTLAALEVALHLLGPGGIMSVCVYPGHEEGAREREAVARRLSGLDVREYSALWKRFVNQPNDPPELFLVQRAGERER